MSNSQKESLRGKSLVKIFLDESLGISKFLDPEHKKEMLTNFLARVYSETEFMINDESYKEVVSYINKDEIAKEIWNKMESGFEMNIHNLETRKISFKFRNFSKAMNYSIEQLMNNERFKISEYIPNNYIIRALSKLY